MESIELGLLRRDFTPALQQACERFLDAAAAAERILIAPDFTAGGGALLDRRLVQMTVAEHQLSRLVLPIRDAMEYFGLPRSITARAMDPEPTVRVQDPARESWDFRPWLSEKTSYLRDNLYALLETIETLVEIDQTDTTRQSAQTDGLSLDVDSAPGERTPSEEKTDEESREDLSERLQERALYELRASASYARDILRAIESMGLSIVDWRIAAGGE